jgi:hypothetical protein
MEIRNLCIAVSGVAQDLIGVCTQFCQGRVNACRRAGQADRLADNADIAARRMLQRRRNAKMLHLRVGKNFVQLVNRTSRNTLLFEFVQPV